MNINISIFPTGKFINLIIRALLSETMVKVRPRSSDSSYEAK